MALLRNDALIKHPYLKRMPTNGQEWAKFIQVLNAQEVDAIVVHEDGFVRSGQTAYDTGTGFWIGNDAGTPKVSIGNSAGNKVTWDGTTLSITGVLSFANTVQTFAPTWDTADFAVASTPSGNLSYINFEAFAIVWNATGGDIVGTSDSIALSFAGLPSAIRPASTLFTTGFVIDNGQRRFVHIDIDSAGDVTFAIAQVSGADLNFSPSAFTAGGNKGLSSGWLIQYPL